MVDTAICLVGYASQPDLQFVCDEKWGQPAWGFPKSGIDEVYIAEERNNKRRYYTFSSKFVTCEECKKKLSNGKD